MEDTPLPLPCYQASVLNPNRVWQTDDIFKKELPVLALQVAYVALFSRIFFFVFRPIHLPHIISNISVGFLLTPSLLGRFPSIFRLIFPIDGIINIEVLQHIGLIFYAFLTGLEMNLDTILRASKKAASIAISGIIFTIVMAPCLYALHRRFYASTDQLRLEESSLNAYILWALVLSITGFPVLAHTLSELKLLHTGLGKASLTTGMISDTYGWILFILFIPFSIHGHGAVYSVLGTIIFIVICVFVVRPFVVRLIDQKTEEDAWEDNQLLFVIMGVLACSFITDILGTHAIVGAFVYGLILPHGRFADLVASISDDLHCGFLAPPYFGGTGMRLLLPTIFNQANWPLTLLVVFLLCIPKILGALFAASFFGMGTRDSLALGMLLNTKGAMALIMMNVGWNRGIFSEQSYAAMASAVLLMTVIVPPVINFMYKPRKRFEQSKLKTIQKLKVDAELRIVACVHTSRHATGMIRLLQLFHASRISPIEVSALYLVELTGRAAAVVAAHIEKPSGLPGVQQNLTKSQAELENITNAFEAFGDACDAVRVETLDVVSSFATIHEDIRNSADEKRASLIILPFHKQLSLEGALETTNVVYRDVNQSVVQVAPCSVGIFVNRDLGSRTNNSPNIVMIFVGGPDDREALAVAWRMARNPGIRLSVVRILLLGAAAEVDTSSHEQAQGILGAVVDNEKQKELDDEYVSSFRLKAVNSEDSISYSEISVYTCEGIPSVLNDIEKIGCELYIVGRGNCRNSRVFSSLMEWCDCAELGVIGDILASNNFGSRSSVLVVQQYRYGGMVFDNHIHRMGANNDSFESLVVQTQ